MARKPLKIRKILIANRGEIALRIIWACKELGIKTAAIYSEPDKDALHVRFADEEVCVGPAKSSESYLNIPNIISAAEITGSDAIHPGYGFLAENPDFAEICEHCDICFIGPSAQLIRQMGDKQQARKIMIEAGVPVTPGSEDIVDSLDTARKVARKIGYPVILKAIAGGGGRGMRIINSESELLDTFESAQSEARSSFGEGSLYIEKYLRKTRHIEFQILGDTHGNIIHLGERECSIQRRYQKLIEESPSPALSPRLRKRMAEVALRGAQAVGYYSAGTIEFLLDQDNNFYFNEMNTRIQVEHTVTEMLLRIDLIKEQIKIAAGEPLSFSQSNLQPRGSSIEARIYAEDPETMNPSPGIITAFNIPKGPGVRVDTAVHEGCWISPYYDPLIAKIVVHGNDRQEAIRRLKRALESLIIEGIKTNIPLHLKVIKDPAFIRGETHTHFLDKFLPGQTNRILA
ncbi:MAG: acetyl-CoA carboxylase biotin carboxylase subunit [Candidatus Aminicenantes bacterium]|nr:acetyl-CoA carboxylase biotin carboxylase subunit [Candidatus Aminicenantes bacterium]MDH5714701.1 acetyl-CoA carboxylase biotin carboxylase subunit [Candidatus Aminicenantes bacterium]